MKILTYLLVLLLIAALGGAAYFYLVIHQPMALDLAKMKTGLPEFERTKRELKKCREAEKEAMGWTGAVADQLSKGLAAEIANGKAEVVVSGSRVVANIDEALLFTPKSITFAKDSQQELATLAAVLKDIKSREISVGVETLPAPAQGKGKKRIPAKDARTLASGRALELVKYLVKNGLAEDSLVAAAYPSAMPDRGFKLKGQKVIIVIATTPSSGGPNHLPAKNAVMPAPATKASATTVSSPQMQIKTIPISTAPPKSVR
jgi:hypothetical protein